MIPRLLMSSFSSISILCLGLTAMATAQERAYDDCGGFSPETVPYLFVRQFDSSELKHLCEIGARLAEEVRDGHRTFEDARTEVYEVVALRTLMCEKRSTLVHPQAQETLESLPGEPLLVVEKYCADTWNSASQRYVNTGPRTAWMKREFFCEVTTNLWSPDAVEAMIESFMEMPVPSSQLELEEIANSLCANVRAGTISVTDALNRMRREFENREPQMTAQAVAGAVKAATDKGKTAVVNFGKLFGAAIGLLATAVTIFVGLKKIFGDRG